MNFQRFFFFEMKKLDDRMTISKASNVGPWQWLSPMAAGFVAVLVGFTSSAVIVYQAAAAAGANAAQTTSWMMALCLGMAATSIALSWRYRVPVLTAWSTPGAAVLASSLVGVPMAEAIGAFVVCGALITLVGVTGWFERVMNKIPLAIASAMLAGVLFRFGVDLFGSMNKQLPLVLAMFVGYLIFKRWQPRYAIPLVLMLGIAAAWWLGLLNLQTVSWSWAQPVWQTPEFSLRAVLSVALPLFLVTMASQNMPGIATLKASGYGSTPISPLIAWTGVATSGVGAVRRICVEPCGHYRRNIVWDRRRMRIRASVNWRQWRPAASTF